VFKSLKGNNKEENYRLMVETAEAFVKDELATDKPNIVGLLSNLSALINVYIEDLNWAGFYLLWGKELVLGPFQGNPACTRIGEGKGVCGRAVLDRKPLIVKDVHQFPGHIACDSASVSELVIPFFKREKVYGVMDLDSPLQGRFSELEAEYLGKIASLLTDFLGSFD